VAVQNQFSSVSLLFLSFYLFFPPKICIRHRPFDGNSTSFTRALVHLAERPRADDLVKVKVSDLKMELVGKVGAQLKDINLLCNHNKIT
jgi:hypothetical protein